MEIAPPRALEGVLRYNEVYTPVQEADERGHALLTTARFGSAEISTMSMMKRPPWEAVACG
jgi:hypothetical protein